ncbi:hypothetical protein GGI07_000293 [Coemansia sp. Benny D115]|nr:hypothetical protein GGI07_000293 [Coemansia sp. Benny D115]
MAARQAPAPTIASAPPAATATNSIHNPAAAASARHHHHHHHHHHHAVTSSYQHQPGTNPGTAPGPIHGPSTAPSSAAAGGMAHPAQGTHLAYPHQQRAQQHVHASMLARTDYRYWPYPQYLQYAHMPPPPPPIPPPSAPGMSTSMTTPWRRERRSKACLRCHTKKIKCEGEGPTCEGCRQAGCECKWVEMKKRGPKPKSKNNGPQRTNNRGSGAETEPSPMPSSKSLRHAPPNNPPGTRGTASGLGVVAPSSAPIVLPSDPAIVSGVRPEANPPATPKIPAPPAPAPSNMDAVMDRFFSPEVPADIRDAVVCYFDYFYGRIPIFHPASFVRRVVEGSVDELLLDTMKAYTARVVMQQTGRHIDIDTITASVRRRLLTGLDRPTIDYVRAVVLASALSGGESKFMSYNSLACLASSLVTRLGWHTLDLDSRSEDVSWDTWVEQEIKRRTFWAVYQLDSYQSLMADRPMTIDPSRIYISTPGSDYTWDDISVPQILHWPTRHQLDISRDTIIRTGALSYTFIELCNIMNIVCQMNEFLWNVKLTISARLRGSLRSSDIRFLQFPPLPNLNATKGEPVTTMFQYPEFVRLHTALLSWRDSLVPAESMRTMSCTPMTDFRRFGSTENRRFAMR